MAQTTGSSTRRQFIKTTGAAMAVLSAAGPSAHAAPNSETLKVGLIGSGGRGTGAARQALLADPNTQLVAACDAFGDILDASLKRMKESEVGGRVLVDEEHRFTGFDGYKGVIEASDVVVLAAPPAFRPKHLAAAIAKGCHVFCEKPVAVDPVGVRSVLETCKKAKAERLSVVSGLCYRYQFAKQETIQRIHDGMIGDITAMEMVYNTGGLWHRGRKPEWSEMEYQVRNWIYFTWLSGDHINEQHIHSLDKIAWVMRDEPPHKATASGGRIQRTDPKYGCVYDHFNTTYEWRNGLKAFSSCRQWEDASTMVYDNVYGTKGTAFIQNHRIRGEKDWAHEKDGPDDMYQNEHNALFEAIRKDEPINNGEYMCSSTMMAIMGRLAAYTGKTITWRQMMDCELSLVPDTLAWGDAPACEIAIPGRYQLPKNEA